MNKRIKVELFQPWQRTSPGNTCPLSPFLCFRNQKDHPVHYIKYSRKLDMDVTERTKPYISAIS
jgi:hypothetical protein